MQPRVVEKQRGDRDGTRCDQDRAESESDPAQQCRADRDHGHAGQVREDAQRHVGVDRQHQIREVVPKVHQRRMVGVRIQVGACVGEPPGACQPVLVRVAYVQRMAAKDASFVVVAEPFTKRRHPTGKHYQGQQRDQQPADAGIDAATGCRAGRFRRRFDRGHGSVRSRSRNPAAARSRPGHWLTACCRNRSTELSQVWPRP